MKDEFEIISHRKIKHINIITNRISHRSLHMHGDFELILVLSGSGELKTSREVYKVQKGSVIILNSYELHEFNTEDDPLTVLIYQISNHFLREYAPYFRFTVFKDGRVDKYLSKSEIDRLFDTAIKCARVYIMQRKLFEYDVVNYVAEIVKLLLQKCPVEILLEKDYLLKKKNAKRIDRIFSYIDANYSMPIRLNDIAKEENITTTHLSHIFTESFGMSFQDYLNDLRFEHAARIITEDNLSLREIAEQSGFSDPKYMTKMFDKKLGIKPKDFRKEALMNIKSVASKQTPEHIFSDEESIALFDKFEK